MHLIFPVNSFLQRLESQQIVSEDKTVVENVVVCHSVRSVVRLFRVFKKDARLQPWLVLLPNPG